MMVDSKVHVSARMLDRGFRRWRVFKFSTRSQMTLLVPEVEKIVERLWADYWGGGGEAV